MKLTLKIWRQKNAKDTGGFKSYKLDDISEHSSFLEMLDTLNQQIMNSGDEPIVFESDCREGICGVCGLVINGVPHGPGRGTTCQLHMRSFKDGDEITIEPWRADAFPIMKDLMVDRSAFDRIIQSGGYISVNTGSARDANEKLIPQKDIEKAFDGAQCIGCGACVAACKNASANLFTAAKVSHLVVLPQGKVERSERVINMVEQHDKEGFGSCSNQTECEAVCPVGVTVSNISRMNREYARAKVKNFFNATRGGDKCKK